MSQVVPSDHPVRLNASPEDQYTLYNQGGTLYYKDAQSVSVSSSDGTVADAASLTLSAPKWVISASQSIVTLNPVKAPGLKIDASEISTGAVTTTGILDATIANADVATNAAIAYAKLATLDTGKVLAGNAGTPTATTLSGDASVGATGTVTVAGASGTFAATGAITPTGGVAAPSGPSYVANLVPASVTPGTDTTPADGTQFVTSIFVPANMTVTNVSFLIGSVGGTDAAYAVIYNNAGTNLKNTTVAGSPKGTTVGTNATVQTIALTATQALTGPARYFVGISISGNTSRLMTVPAYLGAGILAGSVSQTHGTVAPITPPSSFTADKAPYIFLN